MFLLLNKIIPYLIEARNTSTKPIANKGIEAKYFSDTTMVTKMWSNVYRFQRLCFKYTLLGSQSNISFKVRMFIDIGEDVV